MTSNLEPLNPDITLVRKYIAKFDEEDGHSDSALSQLINCFPNNDDHDHVLLKVIAIDALYNTNLDLYSSSLINRIKMANYIVKSKIDKKILIGDKSLVTLLERGHNIKRTKSQQNDSQCYSFVTKYCNWHNSKKYPIYDRYVDGLLWDYKRKDKFYKFERHELRKYDTFTKIIDAFTNFYSLSGLTVKERDKFLWKYGKEHSKEKVNKSLMLQGGIVRSNQNYPT